MPTARDEARRIIEPTATRHGWVIVDAAALDRLRLERETLLAALVVLAGDDATEADRVKARALVAELTEADADA